MLCPAARHRPLRRGLARLSGLAPASIACALGRSLRELLDQRLKLRWQGYIAQSVVHRPKSLAEMVPVCAADVGLRLFADWPERDPHGSPWCFGDRCTHLLTSTPTTTK